MTDLTIETWRHPTTGKLHVHPRCQAVKWFRDRMTPGLINASSLYMVTEMADLQGDWCEWCMTHLILESTTAVESVP
jgi:hypothetical protein